MSARRQASRLVARRGDNARLRAAWPWPRARRAVLGGSAWLELAWGMGRVDDGGTAVLCLQPPRLRDAPRAALGLAVFIGVGFGVAVVLSLWPLLLGVYGTALAAACAGTAVARWRDRGVRRRLDEAKPESGWYMHNFVRHPDHPGAGRALLQRVLDEADEHGRTLYLDTEAARLVEYYAEAGFVAAAAVAAVYTGEAVVITRMVRPPRP